MSSCARTATHSRSVCGLPDADELQMVKVKMRSMTWRSSRNRRHRRLSNTTWLEAAEAAEAEEAAEAGEASSCRSVGSSRKRRNCSTANRAIFGLG